VSTHNKLTNFAHGTYLPGSELRAVFAGWPHSAPPGVFEHQVETDIEAWYALDLTKEPEFRAWLELAYGPETLELWDAIWVSAKISTNLWAERAMKP
jgi:hypothetical protein